MRHWFSGDANVWGRTHNPPQCVIFPVPRSSAVRPSAAGDVDSRRSWSHYFPPSCVRAVLRGLQAQRQHVGTLLHRRGRKRTNQAAAGLLQHDRWEEARTLPAAAPRHVSPNDEAQIRLVCPRHDFSFSLKCLRLMMFFYSLFCLFVVTFCLNPKVLCF